MDIKMLNDISENIENVLIADIEKNSGYINGNLSSSAVATSVAICALYSIAKNKNSNYIRKGVKWLKKTMSYDGGWGDSPESKTNITATLLSYAALKRCSDEIDYSFQKTEEYLEKYFGDISPEKLYSGVLKIYGNDRTFSVPILAMCSICGLLGNDNNQWKYVQRLPYEVALIPQQIFKYLRLPVVSYAIPALISIGILKHIKSSGNKINFISKTIINKCLYKLSELQPEHGGFLEAVPLTSFSSMCLSEAGFTKHSIVKKSEQFIKNSIREDGSFPIDTDLNNWLTCLTGQVIGNSKKLNDINKNKMVEFIKKNQFKMKHKFTGATPGGWGWTDKPGSVPDADDTAAALCSLKILNSKYDKSIENGIKWLMDLQNKDGGIPTFCKGWSKLPFDRSCADISAHTLKAFYGWKDDLPFKLKKQCEKSIQKIYLFLKNNQNENGDWIPLWFGDQTTQNFEAPVYGTSLVIEYTYKHIPSEYRMMLIKAADFIIESQNEDGGWGGNKGAESNLLYTSKALSAISNFNRYSKQIKKGLNYLFNQYKKKTLEKAEPVGLYFAKLWYSENIYNKIFFLNILNKLKSDKDLLKKCFLK